MLVIQCVPRIKTRAIAATTNIPPGLFPDYTWGRDHSWDPTERVSPAAFHPSHSVMTTTGRLADIHT